MSLRPKPINSMSQSVHVLFMNTQTVGNKEIMCGEKSKIKKKNDAG